MSNKNKPCGLNFDDSIHIDIRGENTADTINEFIADLIENMKNVKSNMIILNCQIVPTHFFDLD